MMLEETNTWPIAFESETFNHGGDRITSIAWAPDSRAPTPQDPFHAKIR